MRRFRGRRARRHRPSLGFWLFVSALVLAIALRGRGERRHRHRPPLPPPIGDDERERLAELIIERRVAARVSDSDLAAAWQALRKRARSGRADAVATLFAVARRQRRGG